MDHAGSLAVDCKLVGCFVGAIGWSSYACFVIRLDVWNAAVGESLAAGFQFVGWWFAGAAAFDSLSGCWEECRCHCLLLVLSLIMSLH